MVQNVHVTVDKTSRLLQEVFGTDAPSSETYLNWLYNKNPAGVVEEQNFDEGGERLGHYAIIPMPLFYAGREYRIGLSLNTAVSNKAQGKGVFSKLAASVIDGVAQCGYSGVFGLANANSTPGFIKRLDFKLITPLQVRVNFRPFNCARNVLSGNEALIRVAELEVAARNLQSHIASISWTYELLKWRLEKPDTDYYCASLSDVGLIARRVERGGVGFTVILALFGKASACDVSMLISHACSKLNTLFFVYAGWNADCPVTGIQLPERFKPSPLNLIWREFDASSSLPDPNSFRRFEFLEFDAY